MLFPPDILVLRGLAETLLIGPRSSFGFQVPYALESDEEVRALLRRALAEGGGFALRRHWLRWGIGGDDPKHAPETFLIDQTAIAVRRGFLAAYFVPATRVMSAVLLDEASAEVRMRGLQNALGGDAGPRSALPHPGQAAIERVTGRAAVRPASEPLPANRPLDVRILDVVRRAGPRVDGRAGAAPPIVLEGGDITLLVSLLVTWARADVRTRFATILDAVLLGTGTLDPGQSLVECARCLHDAVGRVVDARSEDHLEEAATLLGRGAALLERPRFIRAVRESAQRVMGARAARSSSRRGPPPRAPAAARAAPPPAPPPPPPPPPSSGTSPPPPVFPSPKQQAKVLKQASETGTPMCEMCT
ncbi:MAG TPA: hypothetical protein VHL98_00565 [Microvirga sp.]|jgi:hypothetical protein|nr:hypothetical protein [Microvirga sp.]